MFYASLFQFDEEADENPSIELISCKKLNRLHNIHLGTKWPLRMKFIFRNKRKEIDSGVNKIK